MCTQSISNVIYHKVSHSLASYKINSKNVNAMSEYEFKTDIAYGMNNVIPYNSVLITQARHKMRYNQNANISRCCCPTLGLQACSLILFRSQKYSLLGFHSIFAFVL